MIHLTIDGKKLEVEEGTTILQAAEKADIHIPTLCYHPLLEPYASCRVCIVEVEHQGKKELLTSCNTLVREGMVVETASERVLRARKLNVEMLLARAPAAEPVKKLPRSWVLRNLVLKLRIPKKNVFSVDFASGPVRR